MGCTKEQWNEVYRKEQNRLRELAKDGYDIDDALDTLEDMNKRMQEGDTEAAVKVVKKHVEQFEELESWQINSVNDAKPRLANGTPITILKGYKDNNGDIMYKAKYPNNDKVYNIPEGRVWYDQAAPKYGIYGNDPHSKDAHTGAYKRLEYEIWNDQGNALKLFDKLAELDGVQDEHTKYLKDLLEQITDPAKEILNKFKVYLNEEAERNQGIAVPYGKDPSIRLSVTDSSNISGGMSATEVFLHEMLHMSVEAARHFTEGPMVSVAAEMRKLYEKAAKDIKREEFPEVYDYIFGGNENGMSEFIAYAMTNKTFKDRLNKIEVGKTTLNVNTGTMWGKLSALVIKMYETLRDIVSTRDPKQPMDERIGQLVTRMWMHNNQTVGKAKGWDRIGQFMEDTTAIVDKGLIKAVKTTGTITSNSLGWVKEKAPKGVKQIMTGVGIAVDMVNPWSQGIDRDAMDATLTRLSDMLSMNPLTRPLAELLAPEGTLRMTLNYFKEDDDEVTRVEKFGLLVQKIDQHREHVIEGVGKDILSKFKKLDHKQQTALTKALLETDVKVLLKDYGLNGVAKLLEDSTEVENEIQKLEGMIDGMSLDLGNTNPANAANNYYKIQAKLLGQYMATGQGFSGLNTNAQSIVEMKGTPIGFMTFSSKGIEENKQELIEIVDKLATMYAIQNANADAKNRTVQLIKEQKEAVENMLAFHTMHALAQFTYKYQVQSLEEDVKGEIKDLKAEYTEIRLAGNSEAEKKYMEKQGFTFVEDAFAQGVGVYKKWSRGMNSFDKQAVAKINEYKDMQNIVSVFNSGSGDFTVSTEQAKEELKRLFKKRSKDFTNMLNGKEPEIDGYIPITNHKTGSVSNFGVTMRKDGYEKITDQDKKAPVVLAKMMGEIGEKLRAKRHNNEVLAYIRRDMDKNYRRGDTSVNRKEYIEIGPDAENRGNIAKDLAKRVLDDMPLNMKEAINAMGKGNRYIAVRRDMVHMYFGMRSPSILNSNLFFMKDTLEHKLNKMNLGVVVEGIKFAGDIWQEVVALNALNIVVKTPMVIITNLLSNMVYSFYLGQLDPLTGMFKAFKDTKEYMDLEKEKISLTLKQAKGTLTPQDKARLVRIKLLQKENPVYDLMEAGLFTSVASDTALVDLKSQTRLGRQIEKLGDKMPEIIKDVGSALYVTESTGLYNAMLMATAYGDFVARVNRYQYLKAKGVSQGNAIKMVTDEFVNYNRLTGAMWKWMKEMGIAQFMQYFFGAVKSMAAKLRDRPSSMLTMNLMLDMPNPGEAMPWNADLGYKFHDPFDIMFEQTPEFIMTPATLRFLGVV